MHFHRKLFYFNFIQATFIKSIHAWTIADVPHTIYSWPTIIRVRRWMGVGSLFSPGSGVPSSVVSPSPIGPISAHSNKHGRVCSVWRSWANDVITSRRFQSALMAGSMAKDVQFTAGAGIVRGRLYRGTPPHSEPWPSSERATRSVGTRQFCSPSLNLLHSKGIRPCQL